MRAFIYVGGEIYPENITEHPKGDDLCIAADSGYANALLLKEHVDVFVGDRDSYGGEIAGDVEIIELKPEKDLTDTQVAFELALSRGADDVIIIGGLSGRLDHTMSNLAILEDANARKVHAIIADGRNRVRFIRNDSALVARSNYKYLSLLAADEKLRGVEIKGVKYPLENAKINRSLQFAVSNEIDGNCAFIAVKKGGLFIIESR